MSIKSEPALTGGCQCVNITYSSSSLPSSFANCHFQTYRKLSGIPFLTFGAFPSTTVTWTSREKSLRTTYSEIAEPTHCAGCGSPISMQYAYPRIYFPSFKCHDLWCIHNPPPLNVSGVTVHWKYELRDLLGTNVRLRWSVLRLGVLMRIVWGLPCQKSRSTSLWRRKRRPGGMIYLMIKFRGIQSTRLNFRESLMSGRKLCWRRDWVRGQWSLDWIGLWISGKTTLREETTCNGDNQRVKLPMNISTAVPAPPVASWRYLLLQTHSPLLAPTCPNIIPWMLPQTVLSYPSIKRANLCIRLSSQAPAQPVLSPT